MLTAYHVGVFIIDVYSITTYTFHANNCQFSNKIIKKKKKKYVSTTLKFSYSIRLQIDFYYAL